VKSDWIQFKLH